MVKLKISLEKYSVVILAAGTGGRMGKIANKIPKCLLKIDNNTILFSIVNKLKSRGLKELNIIVGYKYKMILSELKKIKNLKINYLVSDDFINTDSVYSLYLFKNLLKKIKKNKSIIMLHADVLFDIRFLDNILLSKRKNLIGIREINSKKLKSNALVVKASNQSFVKKICQFKNMNKFTGEIICINKFTAKMFKNIIEYLKIYFKKKTKNISWEYVISEFSNYKKLYILKKQNYNWVNVNTLEDLRLARKLKI